MRLQRGFVVVCMALFGIGVALQVTEGLRRLPDMDISALVTPVRAVTRTPQPTPLPPGFTPRPPTATPPFSLSFEELMAIQSVPSALTTAIAASVGLPLGDMARGLANDQDYEIVRAFRASKRPFHPPLPFPTDVYCIDVYPEVVMTLYIQDYVPRRGTTFTSSADDFEPGEQQRGRIARFIALERGYGNWELYHPEVFNWSALCA